jgi:hypothetical protein
MAHTTPPPKKLSDTAMMMQHKPIAQAISLSEKTIISVRLSNSKPMANMMSLSVKFYDTARTSKRILKAQTMPLAEKMC